MHSHMQTGTVSKQALFPIGSACLLIGHDPERSDLLSQVTCIKSHFSLNCPSLVSLSLFFFFKFLFASLTFTPGPNSFFFFNCGNAVTTKV